MKKELTLAVIGGLAALVTVACQGDAIPTPTQIREVPTATATVPQRRTIELPDLLYINPRLLSGAESELQPNNSFPSDGGWQLLIYAVTNPQIPFTSSLGIGSIFSHDKFFMRNGVYAPANQLIVTQENARNIGSINCDWVLNSFTDGGLECKNDTFPILLRIGTGSPLEASTLTLQMRNGVKLPIYLPSFTKGEACLLAGKEGSTYLLPSCSSADLRPAPDYRIELARQAPPAANQQ